MTPIDSDSQGYIKLHRQILDSEVWAQPNLARVFIWCLLRANHKETWATVTTGRGVTTVKLLPGQFIFGRKQAAKSLKLKPSTVRNCLNTLRNMQNVDTQPDTHYTLVSICNWSTYQQSKPDDGQASGQPTDNQRTTNGQPMDTDKNDKNDKNDKKGEESAPHQAYMDSWNEMATAHGLPAIKRISGKRQQRISTRHAEDGFAEAWPGILKKIPKSDFLMGKDRPWAVTFDFVFKNSGNWLKISEGNYDSKADDAKKKAAELIAKAGRDV